MFRKSTTGSKRERRDRIRWRSHEVTRIEAFSDAVFAFAVTLLIVSLEVPQTAAELLESMHSFIPFSICFALLFQVWMVQNTFFRRFGLSDNTTLLLNAALVFTVLFFVYPLKFLFGSWLSSHHYTITTPQQAVQLFYVYSGGFAAIYLLFTAMYWNALRRREPLQLTPSEAFETRTNIYRNLVMAMIGVLSMFIASFGYQAWAGLVYILIGPTLAITHGRRGRLHRRLHETPGAGAEAEAE